MKFLKKYWAILVMALLILITALAIKGYLKNKQPIVPGTVVNIDSLKQEIVKWNDSYNKEHNTVQVIEIDKQSLQAQLKVQANIIHKNQSKITGLTEVNDSLLYVTSLQIDSVKRKKPNPIAIHDTVHNTELWGDDPTYYFHSPPNKWINVYGSVGEIDTMVIKGTDSLKVIHYNDRAWFLAPLKHYSDFSNSSPYIKIVNIKEVSGYVKDPRFIIAPAINLGYNPVNWKWSNPSVRVGISVIYYPLSIKIK